MKFVCSVALILLASVVLVAQNNPVPFINNPLVPASVAPGGAGFTLTVNGTGFVNGAVVEWNGSPRATTFVSGSQLNASILPSDLSQAATISITVLNPLPGGGVSNPVLFPITIATASVTFSTSNTTVGSSLLAIAAGDFNRDGICDLAMADNAKKFVYVFLGKGDGTFQSPVSYPMGQFADNVLAADFNNDGNLDLLVEGGSESLLLGNGDGTFQPQVFMLTQSTSYSAVSADLNRDGTADLAIQYQGGVAVLLGNGDGTFMLPMFYGTGSDTEFTGGGVALGDFNGDGNLDLVVADLDINKNISVFLGNGDGSFQNAVTVGVGSQPMAVATADLNGDGKLDLVASNSRDNSLSVLLGNGDGTFQPQLTAPVVFLLAQSLIPVDLNADQKLDLLVSGDGGPLALLGNGDGTFQNYMGLVAGTQPEGSVIGDFNNDGRLDIAVANAVNPGLSILLQAPAVGTPPSLNFGKQQVGIASKARNVIITNTGSANLVITSITIGGNQSAEFSQTNNCIATFAPGSTCTVSVIFTPSAAGVRTAILQINDNASGSPQSVPLSGTGTQPAVTLTPPSLTFATQVLGTVSTPQVLTLMNSGQAPLTISSIAASGDFSETNTCGGGIGVQGSCTISVTFSPKSPGTRPGAITVIDDAPDSPQSVTLTGTGTVVSLSPNSLSFPPTLLGVLSPVKSLQLTNVGNGTLTFTNFKVIGTNASDFTETNTCGTSIGPKGTCTIGVTFTPGGIATRSASVSISDDGGGSPQTVALSGTGTEVSLSPTALGFGSVMVGKISPPKTVTLTNIGTSTLTVSKVVVIGVDPGDFSQFNTCTRIAPGAKCSIVLRFIPTFTGQRSAGISIIDDGGGSPQHIELTGTGI